MNKLFTFIPLLLRVLTSHTFRALSAPPVAMRESSELKDIEFAPKWCPWKVWEGFAKALISKKEILPSSPTLAKRSADPELHLVSFVSQPGV